MELPPGWLQNHPWCSPSVSLTLYGGANRPYLSSHLAAAGCYQRWASRGTDGAAGGILFSENVLKCCAESRKEELCSVFTAD